MRLYLSSFQLGTQPEKLAELVGDNKNVAVIINAGDMCSEKDRRAQFDMQAKNMADLGFQPTELDLRNYFGKTGELEKELSKYGAVWLKGGNAFVLKRAFEQSGFDTVIKSF